MNRQTRRALERLHEELKQRFVRHVAALDPGSERGQAEILRIDTEGAEKAVERLWPSDVARLKVLYKLIQNQVSPGQDKKSVGVQEVAEVIRGSKLN